NTPPPTTLSPLSLHDALPILGLRKTRLVGLGPSLGVQHLEDRESDHLLRIEIVLGAARMRDELPAQVAPPLVNDVVLRPFFRIEDRKSTRLNSSHVAISYAVF